MSNIYQYGGHRNGEFLPPQIGSTGDDRMDLACSIGHDLVPSLPEALMIAERILSSKLWDELVEKIER